MDAILKSDNPTGTDTLRPSEVIIAYSFMFHVDVDNRLRYLQIRLMRYVLDGGRVCKKRAGNVESTLANIGPKLTLS